MKSLAEELEAITTELVALRRAVKPFYTIAIGTSGRIPTERLSADNWNSLWKAYEDHAPSASSKDDDIESSVIFRCAYSFHYMYENQNYVAVSRRGVEDFKYGFWVNKNMQFTTDFDCLYWIPPSAIMCIKKDKTSK